GAAALGRGLGALRVLRGTRAVRLFSARTLLSRVGCAGRRKGGALRWWRVRIAARLVALLRGRVAVARSHRSTVFSSDVAGPRLIGAGRAGPCARRSSLADRAGPLK